MSRGLLRVAAICMGAAVWTASLAATPCRTLYGPDPNYQMVAASVQYSVFRLFGTANGKSATSGSATLIALDGKVGYFLTVLHNFDYFDGFKLGSDGTPVSPIELRNSKYQFSIDRVYRSTGDAWANDVALVRGISSTEPSGLDPVEIAIGWAWRQDETKSIGQLVVVGYWVSDPLDAEARRPIVQYERLAKRKADLTEDILKDTPDLKLTPRNGAVLGTAYPLLVRSGDSGSLAFDSQSYGIAIFKQVRQLKVPMQGINFDRVLLIPVSADTVQSLVTQAPPTARATSAIKLLQNSDKDDINIPNMDSLSTLEWFSVANSVKVDNTSSDWKRALRALANAQKCRPIDAMVDTLIDRIGASSKLASGSQALDIARAASAIAAIPPSPATAERLNQIADSSFARFHDHEGEIIVAMAPQSSAEYLANGYIDYAKHLAARAESNPKLAKSLRAQSLKMAGIANERMPSSTIPFDIAAKLHIDDKNFEAAVGASAIATFQAPTKAVSASKLKDLQWNVARWKGVKSEVTCSKLSDAVSCFAGADTLYAVRLPELEKGPLFLPQKE